MQRKSNREFLHWAFRELLKRLPSESEQGSLLTALEGAAMTRLQVLELIVEGIEFKQSVAHREFVPPGHFYSVVPSEADRERAQDWIARNPSVVGVDFAKESQLALAREFEAYYDEGAIFDEPTSSARYYANNNAFSWQDAFVLSAMIRHHQPSKIIEVGSGFSSAMMLDTVEKISDYEPAITFIEPYPDALGKVLRDKDREKTKLINNPVQEVSLDVFAELRAGDVLFIDSTHVSKLASDVNFLFFEVLPRLASGVIVHVHDMFYPFEYPNQWIEQGRAWNELYIVRALLSGSTRYSILFFNHYLATQENSYLAAKMPRLAMENCGSLWLRVN